ncbi:hypothetical protein AVEN_155656-1 [Araneus ventricosus]|uniref:Uncharacterized protein n=1 Tax=Araneus ventricosus TaxID=182803 RepID=A0A4Y2RKH8_ARAVE|nr:hypothetical protein AVEN_155656-1 [Araneus ventricosus]
MASIPHINIKNTKTLVDTVQFLKIFKLAEKQNMTKTFGETNSYFPIFNGKNCRDKLPEGPKSSRSPKVQPPLLILSSNTQIQNTQRRMLPVRDTKAFSHKNSSAEQDGEQIVL